MRVLVATDGSTASGSALRFALGLVSAAGGRLHVITVGEVPVALTGPRRRVRLSAFEKAERRFVRTALERARRIGRGARVQMRLAYVPSRDQEPFARTIARAARRIGADLVVVGSRGGTAASRALLGSIPHRLVHGVRIPVALVRAGVSLPRRGPRTVLVATDGSPGSGAAVRYAGSLVSRIRQAQLWIVHVSTLPRELAYASPGLLRAFGLNSELDRAEWRESVRILERARKQSGLPSRVRVRSYRPSRPLTAAEAILAEAKRLGADILILGRTGRSAFGDVALGSVAQRVLTLSHRPIVLVPDGRGTKKKGSQRRKS
jgi:nucleotide-binding universal stress UspA family protein